jgi:hypothetical protein
MRHQGSSAKPGKSLIVELKSNAVSPAGLTAQTAHDRLAPVARAAGMPALQASPQRVGERGYLLHFNALQQGAAADPVVQSVSLDMRVSPLDVTPNDPCFSSGNQWYLRTTSAGGVAALNTPQAWGITTGLNSPVVAVVDVQSLDLSSRLIAPGDNFISDTARSNTALVRNPDASDPGDWVTSAESSPAPQVEDFMDTG